MKKYLLFILVLFIGISSYAQYEGFENWTTNSVQTLDNYESAANNNGTQGSLATYPVNDPITGALSIKLKTIIGSAGDTIFGYFLSGNPDTQAPGQAISLPPVGAVDSIIGWYKYDVQAGDSCALLAMTTLNGTPTGGGQFYVTGQQLTWKRFAYYVGAPASDSLFLAGTSGDPINNFNGIAGTWIQFDDIQLVGPTATANVINYSFENWLPISWEEPNGWQTGNQWAIGEPAFPVIKTTDSYTGSFALELNLLAGSQPGDTLYGAATNGYWNQNGAGGGEPFTGSPTDVEFYYKHAPAGTDTASVSIQFKQGSSIVGFYGYGFGPAVSNYTLWTQSISPITPDSVLIAIWVGNNIGSQFKIDDIDFVFPVGVSEDLTVDKLVTYPNPASDVLKIKFNIVNDNDVKIRLIDALGEELTNRSMGHLSAGTYRESFNTSNFTAGVYFIEFILDNEKVVNRFVVK